MPEVIIAVICIPILFVVFNFIYFLVKGKIKTNILGFQLIEIWTIVILPTIFLANFDIGLQNDCCYMSAIFSPENSIGIYTIIISAAMTYLLSAFRKEIFTPILELLLNIFLVLGIVVNSTFYFHFETLFWLFGNISIILLYILKLMINQKLLVSYISQNSIENNTFFSNLAFKILTLPPLIKYPIFVLLLLPILILLSLFLLIFGQKPDTLIRAYTDTYKQGLSQLDYMCDNVHCGGHFLCSVGANGHKLIVKPIRYGERNGTNIICNRQLLISNAFEDLVQEKFPQVHFFIRKQYNKVGNLIHRYYAIFSIKIVSDIVYVLMKPFEWLFLIALYTFDKKPENRIEKQYISPTKRNLINIYYYDSN